MSDATPAPTTNGMRVVELQTGLTIRAFLEDAYLVRRRSLSEIAAEIDVDPATVSRWLRAHGIQARPIGRHARRAAA